MKKTTIIFLVIIASCYGCSKDDNETIKYVTGTFSGQKTVHYFGTNTDFTDTIKIIFENTKYTYFSSTSKQPGDSGYGSFLIKNNSIEFKDEVARITLYTWDWILSGNYQFQIAGDSLFLNQKNSSKEISCRLKKVTNLF
jgi:hypothetical protein